MAIILFLFLFLFSPSLPFQQTYVLLGNIRDSGGQVVSSVRVSVMDENSMPIRTLIVDSSGRFSVRGLRAGVYLVRIETTGTPYEEQTLRLELFSGRRSGQSQEPYPIDFVLKFKKSKEPIAKGGTVFAQTVPKAARDEYERALKSLKANKTEQALPLLKKAVELFPDYYEALETLGVEYVKGGQYETALPLLTRALEINKSGARSLYGLGVAYLNLNRYNEAIERLETCAQLNPRNPNTQMMLGLAYGQNRVADKAEAAFKKALQIGGAEAAEAHFYLAGLYNKQGRYRQARQELESFLRQSKNVKDPAQIKAMIERLKEKEKSPPAAEPEKTGSDEQAQLAAVATAPAGARNSETARTSALPGMVSAAESVGVDRPKQVAEAAALPSENSENKAAEPPAPVPPLAPEMAELLKQSEAAGGAMSGLLLNYTYQLKKTRRVLDEQGKPSKSQEQIFEAYPIQGEHVLIRLSTDGVESRTLADDRKRAAKALEEAELRRGKEQLSEGERQPAQDYVSAGVSGIYNNRAGYVSINVSAILDYCEFFAPRLELMAGRPTVAYSFRPRFGGAAPPNYAYLKKLAGTLWVDQQDKVVARLEGWPNSAFDLISSTASVNEAALIYQQERQTNGAWFPALIRMNARGRADLFNGLNWDVVFEFSNYRRFDTDATEKLNKPGAKPN
ncbi:MAG: tetratricopeptide repeat protein [Blastocatellia bacterium]